MKKDLYKQYHKEVFDYEMPKEEFTPGFIIGVALSLLAGVGLVILFAMVVASGFVFIGSQL